MNYKKLAPKLFSLGYEPLAIRPGSKAPFDTGWSSMSITEETVVKRSISASITSGVGIRCGTGSVAVYAVDFDFYDKDISSVVAKSFFESFGKGPVRIGQMPKALSVYIGEPGQPKIQTEWTSPDGVKHKFELLGAGQQFIAYGIHPDTKKAYTWPNGGLDSIETWELPQLDFDKVTDWVNNVLPGLVPSDWVLGSKTVKSKSTKPVDAFEHYKPPLDGWDLQRVVTEILPHIDPSMGNQDWVQVGFALYHQGGGGSDWLAAFDEWSSEGSNYEDGVCEQRWPSFSSEGRSGDDIKTLASLLDSTKEARAKVAELATAAAQEEAVSLREKLAQRITSAATEADLRTDVCLDVQLNHGELDKADLTILAKEVQAKFKALGLGCIGLDDARALLAPPKQVPQRASVVPDWAQSYVYVTQRAQIFRYDSNEWLTREAFDFKHNPDAGLDEEGNQMSAYAILRDNAATQRVEQAVYIPHLGPLFSLDGVACVNTYRPSSVPKGKPEAMWTEADRKAVSLASRHIELICNKRPEVFQSLMDWLAFNVQNPGVKITYTWLIVGGEGVGKTWVGQMMAVAMGRPNVRVVSVQTVISGFNGWAEGSAFSIIEEVRMHGHKKDAWDMLKEPLSNNVIEVVRKGMDGYNIPNSTNYLLLSNHNDAVPITMGSRRVGVIKTPFSGDDTAAQLNTMAVEEGFGDSSAYFDALFDAVNKHPEAIREWLSTLKVSGSFNPNGRAPLTDERAAMAIGSLSSEELDIRDAIANGSFGVSKVVVSPKHLKIALSMSSDCVYSIDSITRHLSNLGYSPYGDQVKWRDTTVRPWVKGLKLSADKDTKAAASADKALIREQLEATDTSKVVASGDSFLE